MPKPVLTVELKELNDRASEATQFLKSKVEGKMRTKGTQLQIEGAKTKQVKLLLHKFLHHPEREGSPPTAAQTTPYLFPQTPALTPEKRKRAKPKHKRE